MPEHVHRQHAVTNRQGTRKTTCTHAGAAGRDAAARIGEATGQRGGAAGRRVSATGQRGGAARR
ncbi:hypothetical protein ACFWF7_43830, partial [Nocardia sp. NPDC060256]|uniref:hypothetical protein n=1 Tax=Nocardia sp. NPDC060256 TaxID=3347086 RepID=UPI0036495BCC